MKLRSIALAGLLLMPLTSGAADDPIAAARDLYASAAYEEALSMLTRLTEGAQVAPNLALQIDKYRSFCLYALGRTAEAESIAQSVIRKEPLFQLEGDDVSPRVEAMFKEASRKVLPGLIRDTYRLAKLSIDRKDFASAEPQLLQVHRMIGQAEKLGFRDESMTDLDVLAEGFRDLALASAMTKPAAATPDVPTPLPVGTPMTPTKTASAQAFDQASPGVSPPVPILQSIPPMPAALVKSGTHGVLEVIVEADGRVVDAVMRESVNSM
jgi:hypothetical protein